MVKVLGLLKANFYTAKRYKIDWWSSLLMPLFSILPAILIIWAVGESGTLIDNVSHTNSIEVYIKYLILGIVYWGYVEVFWSTVFMLRTYMKIGQFEDIFMSPITGVENILGWSLLGIIRVTIETLPIIIISVIIIGIANITLSNILVLFVVFIMSILASFGLTFLIFGVTLIIKEGDQIASLIGNAAPFLCGLYFPVTILPLPLKAISFIFPFTWGIDIIRNCILNTNTIIGLKYELIVLFFMTCMYLFGGHVAYKLLEKKSRKSGVQGF